MSYRQEILGGYFLLACPAKTGTTHYTVHRQQRSLDAKHQRRLHLLDTGLFSFHLYFTKKDSAIADKPRDAFMGQSRSPNMVPFHMLGMVSYYCAM